MTAPSPEFVDYVIEHLEPLVPLFTSRFFGGVGISNGVAQFAMIIGNSLYFVVDDVTRPKYELAGMQAFSYSTKKGVVQVRRYFEVPKEVLTDAEQLKNWLDEAINIAVHPQKSKRPVKSAKPKPSNK